MTVSSGLITITSFILKLELETVFSFISLEVGSLIKSLALFLIAGLFKTHLTLIFSLEVLKIVTIFGSEIFPFSTKRKSRISVLV